MRKWIVLPLLLVVCAVFLYAFIPSNVAVNEEAELAANNKAFIRVFFNQEKWKEWWPNDTAKAQANQLIYNGWQYKLVEKRYSSVLISLSQSNDTILTELLAIPLEQGKVRLSWIGNFRTGVQPFGRIQRYGQAKDLRSDLQVLLGRIKTYYAEADHLYGFHIEKALVKDSLLISLSQTSPEPLSSDGIYAMIDRLKAYAQKKEAQVTGLPMLNALKAEGNSFLTRVALPVNKRLPDEDGIQFKRMLGNGNILITEVKGGPWQIQSAFLQMQNYIEDNKRTAPAIEFESLVTDRRAERDTNKWVTKLYWPVM